MPVELSRDLNGKPITNVPHRVTRGDYADIDKKDYEWGHVGAGPDELSLNILYNHGLPEKDALALSAKFSQDIISGIPVEGARISAQVIEDWIRLNSGIRAQGS